MTQVNRLSFDMELTKLSFNATGKYASLTADSRYSLVTRVASLALTVIALVAETLKNIIIAPVKAVVFAGQGVASLFKRQDPADHLKEAVENNRNEEAAAANKQAAIAEENEFASNLSGFAQTKDCKKSNAKPRTEYQRIMRKFHHNFEMAAADAPTTIKNGIFQAPGLIKNGIFQAPGLIKNGISSLFSNAQIYLHELGS